MEDKNLTLREIQLEELEILKKVTEYIEKKELSYFLAGGTLLGAIRHDGFIPWDDDIDILMPRPDYESLLDYLKKESIDENYEILTLENEKHSRAFAKIINRKISIESKSKEDRNLWIDIFPIDGLPEKMEDAKKIIKKGLFLKGQIYLRTTKVKEILKERRKIFNKIIKILLKPFTYRQSLTKYSQKMNILAKKYDYNNSSLVGDLVWPDGEVSIFKKEWFESFTQHKFENELFRIPIGWEEYLKSVYGNYMELPPEEKRVDHKIIAKKYK